MSTFDPLALAAAAAVADAAQTIANVTLNLGVSADVIKAQIRPGDLIDAIVLPPQNGSDRLSLFGRSIDAQLPPGIHPGESLLLSVTAISGQQIFVRNLGPVDPQSIPPVIYVELPPQQDEPARPATPPQAQPVSAPSSASAPATAPSLAPPREVFVAASVVQIEGEAELRAVLMSPAGEAARSPNASRAPIAPRTMASQTLPSPQTPAAMRSPLQPARIQSTSPTPPAALLARLRVPISSATLIAARLVDDAARHVTSSYQRLDEALAKLPTSDPRVGSLRALLSFTGKIDMRNGRALPEAIAAFVSHVVESSENKIAQLVRLLATPTSEPEAPTTPAGSLSAPAIPQKNASTPAAAPSAPPPALPLDASARASERAAALDHDVKTIMLSLIQAPPREMNPQVMQALSSAVGATTAVQLNVLSAQNIDANTIAIPLPAYFHEGGRPTELRITRDPGKSGKGVDADNFSVSFVLDTKTLGTVAIDLQTVGRAVSVNVKTERASAAEVFRDSLAHLRGRLEALRYRIASMGAEVSRRAAPSETLEGTEIEYSVKTLTNVDLRA